MAFIELCPSVCTDPVLCCAATPTASLAVGMRAPIEEGRRARTLRSTERTPLPQQKPQAELCRMRCALTSLVDFVLEYVQVVGGGHRNDVVSGVPRRVQNLLIEVQTVHTDLVLLPLPAWAHSPRLQTGSRLAVLSGSFQGHVPPRVSVKHPEEVVVGSRHDRTAQTERSTCEPAGT